MEYSLFSSTRSSSPPIGWHRTCSFTWVDWPLKAWAVPGLWVLWPQKCGPFASSTPETSLGIAQAIGMPMEAGCYVMCSLKQQWWWPLSGSGMEGWGSADMAQASQQLDGGNASRDHDGWLTVLSHFPGWWKQRILVWHKEGWVARGGSNRNILILAISLILKR